MENISENNNQENQQPDCEPAIITQTSLPNSTAVLVLGILSIVFCWCYGVIGVILGIIALILAGKDLKLYKENPKLYSESSYKNLSAGKVTAIIGLVLSGLFLLYVIVVFALYGSLILTAIDAQSSYPF